MNPQFIAEMKQKLEAEQQELRSLLSRSAEKDAHVMDEFHSRFPQYGDEEEDNASEVEDYEHQTSIEAQLESALQQIDAALARIDAGNYGICAVGGEAIAEERLKVAPAASTCVEHSKAGAA